MTPLEEVRNLAEDYGWDMELLDQVRDRMAALEKVAELARQIQRETTLDLPHLDDAMAEALAELDGAT